MAAKKRALLLFALATIFASAPAFASIPRRSALTAPAIDRFSNDDRHDADQPSIDNVRLMHRALARALPAPAPIESLSKSRVWAFSRDVELTHRIESPLTRALRRASARSWPGIASDRTVLTPDPLGYADSSNLYSYAAGDPVNNSDPTGLLCDKRKGESVFSLDYLKRCSQDALTVAGELGEAANKTFVQFNIGAVEGVVNLASGGQYNGVKQAIQQGKIRVPHSLKEANEVAQNINDAQLHGVGQFVTFGTLDRSVQVLQQEGGTPLQAAQAAAGEATGISAMNTGVQHMLAGDPMGAAEFAGGFSKLTGTAAVVLGGFQAATSTETTTAISPYRRTTANEMFYHYGFAEHASNFQGGLRAGAFATSVGDLSGAAAQRGLALPRAVPPNAVYTVTPEPGTWIRTNPITRANFGQPGGLPEYQFLWGTGPGTVSPPRSIP